MRKYNIQFQRELLRPRTFVPSLEPPPLQDIVLPLRHTVDLLVL